MGTPAIYRFGGLVKYKKNRLDNQKIELPLFNQEQAAKLADYAKTKGLSLHYVLTKQLGFLYDAKTNTYCAPDVKNTGKAIKYSIESKENDRSATLILADKDGDGAGELFIPKKHEAIYIFLRKKGCSPFIDNNNLIRSPYHLPGDLNAYKGRPWEVCQRKLEDSFDHIGPDADIPSWVRIKDLVNSDASCLSDAPLKKISDCEIKWKEAKPFYRKKGGFGFRDHYFDIKSSDSREAEGHRVGSLFIDHHFVISNNDEQTALSRSQVEKFSGQKFEEFAKSPKMQRKLVFAFISLTMPKASLNGRELSYAKLDRAAVALDLPRPSQPKPPNVYQSSEYRLNTKYIKYGQD